MFEVKKIKEKLGLTPKEGSSEFHWVAIILIATVFVLLVSGTAVIWLRLVFQNKFFPGAKIGNINLAGLSKQEAFQLVNDRVEKINQGGIKISYQNGEQKEVNVININNLSDPDLSRTVLEFDVYKTVYEAYGLGRGDGVMSSLLEQLQLLLGGKKVEAKYVLDEDLLDKMLRSHF
jgi:hypothetical protein